MSQWANFKVNIDNQAKIQLEHYFNDLEKILERQQLLYKKDEVFKELENHIEDYIRNKQISEITFNESLLIISELGPPDNYLDYSTLPGLMDKVKKDVKKAVINQSESNSNFILCEKCNTKNEVKSVYCMNCGEKLLYEQILENNTDQNRINYFLSKKIIYFFNILSVFLFIPAVFSVSFYEYSKLVSTILIKLFLYNELILIPGIILLKILYSPQESNYIFESSLGYTVKILSFFIPVIIFSSWLPTENPVIISFFMILMIVITLSITKILFYSPYSKKVHQFANATLTEITSLITLIMVLSLLILIFGYYFGSISSDLLSNDYFQVSGLIQVVYILEVAMTVLFGVGSLIIYKLSMEKYARWVIKNR